MGRPGTKPAKRQVVTACGRPATGRFEPKASRTTFNRRGAVFAGLTRSTAVTVTTRGPSSATGGAAISVVNMPAASACAALVTSPAIAPGAPGGDALPGTAP